VCVLFDFCIEKHGCQLHEFQCVNFKNIDIASEVDELSQGDNSNSCKWSTACLRDLIDINLFVGCQ
jgi:hypothetical protein